jgi:hypothetical protein
MNVLKAITDAIYREYDRRIKRASLITEYGVHHHDHGAGHEDHAEEQAEAAHAAEEGAVDEEEAEITNVPRGTPVAMSEHPPAEPAAADDTAPAEATETT